MGCEPKGIKVRGCEDATMFYGGEGGGGGLKNDLKTWNICFGGIGF